MNYINLYFVGLQYHIRALVHSLQLLWGTGFVYIPPIEYSTQLRISELGVPVYIYLILPRYFRHKTVMICNTG